MTQGRTPDTPELLNRSREFCNDVLPENSIYRLLFREGHHIFPDDVFSDLYSGRGRQSVPPQVLAICTVLQRLEGLSDREAVERFMFDARWKYAAGGLSPDYPGFVHTVLVGFRARLRESDSPNRIFEAVLEVAKQAGLVGHRRALDSTPLYDAVATQDTVTMIRAAIRGVLRVCAKETETRVRAVLKRDDSYDSAGKPVCDWDDAEARSLLVDALARDGYAVLSLFDNEKLDTELEQAVILLATILGQDLEENEEGLFRIARRVAKDRVISTVDPEARHGHKTSSRSFDGYKGHIAVDPDTEIITATVVTAGNAGDASVVDELLSDVLPPQDEPGSSSDKEMDSQIATVSSASQEPQGEAKTSAQDTSASEPGVSSRADEDVSNKPDASTQQAESVPAVSAHKHSTLGLGRLTRILFMLGAWMGLENRRNHDEDEGGDINPVKLERTEPPMPPPFEVYGDASYGTAVVLEQLDGAGIKVYTKVQHPVSLKGRFDQSKFSIDLVAAQVSCPQGFTVDLKFHPDGSSVARFGARCETCPLREQCTTAKGGRSINVHAKHETLQKHREQQRESAWQENYRSIRPKVERKFGHLVRRKHGGRRARVRGVTRVDQDFSFLAAAINLARLTRLGLIHDDGFWAITDPRYQTAMV
jgi:IS5 family transposase